MTENASVAMESALGFQEIYLLIFLFALVANRSMFSMFCSEREYLFCKYPFCCILELPRFLVYFDILFVQVYWWLRSRFFAFSPCPYLLCYFVACNWPRTTHIIYVSNCSCTLTHNCKILTQEISLKRLKGNKHSKV